MMGRDVKTVITSRERVGKHHLEENGLYNLENETNGNFVVRLT
jgi:hypothetical protein